MAPRALADLFGVSQQYIHQLCDKGLVHRIDVGSYDLLPTVRDYVRFLRKKNETKQVETQVLDPSHITLEEAKRLKAIKEVEKLDLQNAREKGELISKSAVRDKAIKAGAILAVELASIENDMPGQIEGANAALIRDRLSGRFNVLLERFREKLREAEEAEEKEQVE